MSSKGEALAAVHAAMDNRLFGEGDWLTDRDSSKAVDRLLHERGFLLRLSDSSSRSTPLGKEIDVDLLMCFLGIFDEWEVPNILHFRGYLDLYCNPSGLLS
jgi:hypothetical protein